MLHPGYDDSVLAAQDPYRAEREREIAVLTSGLVRGRLQRGDMELINFGGGTGFFIEKHATYHR